jgi:hypothetical protein
MDLRLLFAVLKGHGFTRAAPAHPLFEKSKPTLAEIPAHFPALLARVMPKHESPIGKQVGLSVS